MEAEPGRPEGECSERQEHVTETSVPSDPGQISAPRPAHRSRGRLQHRSPRSPGLLLRFQQQQALAWQPSDAAGPSGGSFLSPSSPSSFLPSTSSARGDQGHRVQPQTSQDPAERLSSPKRGEKKPQKPGKYVCSYCGRPCAKPSVLQKHIRSHTGERPYPCDPCGFSFKTKSNLYKHRKSHAHRIKAGLMSCREELSLSTEGANVGEEHEEPTEGESTESEEETGQRRKPKDPLRSPRKEESHRPEDSQAVKQRLALRLSERKRGPKASPDDPPSSSLSTSSSSLGPGSKGSTESGYFSGSGSTDLSQISPPSASAKTYAEIILGKYGRLGGQQRGGHQQQPHASSGTEEKSISFTVPKTQVIEHITKLITINEAVVDTSEIDSVKPRRSSLSRKSSMESPKISTPKDPYAFDPKAESPGPSGLRPGSPEPLSSVPLLRSHSLPSSTSQEHTPSSPTPMSPGGFRLCQSFDEQQAAAAEMRVGHVQRMLRRQPAIEVPLGAEQVLEDTGQSSSGKGTDRKRQPKQQLHKSPCLFECEACGSLFQHSESYESHMGTCPGHHHQPELEAEDKVISGRDDHPHVMMHYKLPALAVTVRKRRKEESLEEDPPSPTTRTAVSGGEERSHSQSGVPSEPKQQQQDRKGVSVIQHTSSFEKQESVSMESQGSESKETQPQPKPSPSTSRLIRQPNIQVPEILVTLEPDTDMPPVSPTVTVSLPKEAERVEQFQWPQRSQTLAQLPAEKLPPKKKRLRLAEAAQSSGESSFESVSVPRSPSQESTVSLSSSLSVSLEDPVRSEAWATSHSSQMLTVPSASHQCHQSHKEMRRSASEQTPPTHQQPQQTPENRSKSFDYGCLSSQQPTTSWKERRKCLLVKHATLGDPEEEQTRADSPRPGPSHVGHHPLFSTEEWFLHEESGETLTSSDVLSLVPRDQQTSGPSLSHVLPTEVLHRAFFEPHIARLGTPLHHLLPLQFSSHSQALYFPFSSRPLPYAPLAPSSVNRSIALSPTVVTTPYHDTPPIIATCLAQLTPVVPFVVPVRLQTHMPTYASAMYTTLSQILASSRSPEPICTTMVVMSQLEQNKLQRSYLTVPALKMKTPISLTPSLVSLDEEAYGPLGAGGSKRMLSPAASLELSTEAQRHQKRVKEEEEGEQGSTGERSREKAAGGVGGGEVTGRKVEEEKNKQTQNAEDKYVKVEKKQEENQASAQNPEVTEKKEGTRPVSASHPSLHTYTSVNWCYLNYIKPNPSAQQDSQTSVYSSWSVSVHNPNLPGLSTKTALSLLCTKQRHSAETYTMATASQAKEGGREPQQETELQINPAPVSPVVSGQIKEQPQHEKNKAKPKRDEEATTSKSRESSCVCIFEGGYRSSEEYVYVRGRGRGKYICGECGIRCKKPSMLKKHIRTHTDVRPYVCKHCNFAFKTKGNLTKHMKSKAHGKKCQSVGVSESSLDEPESEETGGSEEPVPEEQEEHQFSDVDESEDDDEEEDEESTTQDDPPSSCSSDTHPSIGGRSTGSGHSHQGTPDRELPGPTLSHEPSPRGLRSSPCSRRALFSRRGIRAARAFSPSSESCSPSRSLSPRLELSPAVLSLSPKTELSSPSRHVSPSPERGPSPIRPLSPLRPTLQSFYQYPQARAPPSPLGLHRRTPALLPWESPATRGANSKEEKCRTTWEGQTFPESSLFPSALRLSTCESYPGAQPVDNIFSHLPLHSQQARLPCVMIPIGGIQMVQARPRSHPTTPSSPTSPPIEGSSRLSFDSVYWAGTPRTQGLRTPSDQSLVSEQTGTSQPHGDRTQLHKHKPETDSKQYSSSHSSVQTPRGSDGTPVRDTGLGPALSPAVSVAECSRGHREQPPPGGNVEEGTEQSDQST
ncbi:transcription factor HIVEP3 [Periophthalmus magnuspinnatus]|uniref:transcription factor HIVEP3 n=1 Tax=Periophthalmus magnuspinnatus TaxID=409849 RepID=UPI00145BE7CE|nr:transcription factor HIVEP3 [Periophthalmus magnuspinnatus]